MDDELTMVSAATLARAIRNKEVSSAEVVAAHLARIAQVNPSLNAVVCLAAESAVEAAREADAAGLERGVELVHAVPVLGDLLGVDGLIGAPDQRWLNSNKGTKCEIGFYLRPFRPWSFALFATPKNVSLWSASFGGLIPIVSCS